MGDGTSIEWTDATWNPVVGCSKVSPGCEHCYAIGVTHRGLTEAHRGLTVVPEGQTRPEWNGRINVAESRLDQPLRWRRPRRIFVNSLSDLFHPGVLRAETSDGRAPLIEVLAVMAAASQHTFQVLTKRPKIMQRILGDPQVRLRVNARLLELGYPVMPGGMTDPGFRWPAHIWWGVSVESNEQAWRANVLRDTAAAVRWVSAEPLLGPLDQLDLTGIDWVVAGGESGPGARPMHPAWVRDLRDRCLALACPRCHGDGEVQIDRVHGGGDVAAVAVQCSCRGGQPGPAFLFKQWGDHAPRSVLPTQARTGFWLYPDGATSTGTLSTGRAGAEAMYRVGKKAAGRALDGRTWDEYPEIGR